MKRFGKLVVLGLLAFGGYYYYSHLPSPTEMVLTGIVTTDNVIVSPQIGGQIAELLVKEGDTVTAGQLVAVIVPDELQADRSFAGHNVEGFNSQIEQKQAAARYTQRQTEDQIQQAEATLEAMNAQHAVLAVDLDGAKTTLDRIQGLSRQGIAPTQQLDQAKTAYDAVKARIEALNKQMDAQRAAVALAKTNEVQVEIRRSEVTTTQQQRAAADAQRTKADVRLSYTNVRAPIGGIVDIRAVRAGEVVNAGQPMITLVNPDDFWVRVDIEESYIERIRLGDRFTVRLPSGDERPGTVFFRAPDSSFATQRDVSRTKRDIKTFTVRLRVDNADRRLAVGMTTYVLLPLK